MTKQRELPDAAPLASPFLKGTALRCTGHISAECGLRTSANCTAIAHL